LKTVKPKNKNMKTLISHEIPKELFRYHDYINDYPYLLAHLLLKEYHYDGEYADFYKACVKRFGYSILDNSCFELGFPVEANHLIDLAKEYGVSHIVLPDAYRDFKKTMEFAEENIPKLYGKSQAKLFAVLQGKNMQEMLDCYDYYDSRPEIDIIGINFMRLPESNNASRHDFFKFLLSVRRIKKKIHFLGCENPGEFKLYKGSELENVYSIDTSSPIMNGWKGNRFTENGLEQDKPKEKLADNLDMALTEAMRLNIAHNCKLFKRYVYDKPLCL
jgi:hypothetical protein